MHARLLRINRARTSGDQTPTKKDWEHLQRVWNRQTTREGMDMSHDQIQLEADRKLKERIAELLQYKPDAAEVFLQRLQKSVDKANTDLKKTSAPKHLQRAKQLKNSYERTIMRMRHAMENLNRSLSKQDREALHSLLEWAEKNHRSTRITKARVKATCANCGREFDKIGMRIYCSFTCVQEAGQQMSGAAAPQPQAK